MARIVAVMGGLVLAASMASSCWAQSLTTTQEGAIGGAVVGAGTGAIVGAAEHHHPLAGAAIGGGIGLVAGGLIGHELENDQNAQSQQQAEIAAQQAQIQRQRLQIEQLQQIENTE
jgi:osmotically inducible lipoprotein OsmB